ncbi:hypothetical protein [Zavarzinella formosa]|uniref:hypothetical protein n=1 Tax=Zavarzinella formosa TaxID=360055 RepID=UPI0012F91A33|nr:hypothetical protein [Zavarzinella formosa]
MNQTKNVPEPLTITKGDKTLRLIVGQPGPSELYAFRRWARTKLKARTTPLSELGLDGLSPNDRKTLIDSYVRHCAAVQPEPSVADFIDLMQTPSGCARMVWLSSRRTMPELKLADVEAMINEQNADAVLAGLDPAAGLTEATAIRPEVAGKPERPDGGAEDEDDEEEETAE